MLLRCGALGDLRDASYGELGKRYASHVRSSLWLALRLTTKKKANHDKSVAALKCLLQHGLCPHDVAYRCRLGRDDIGDMNLLQLEAGNDLLFRVFVRCEPRCCCEMCDRAVAMGRFRETVPKNTFKHLFHMLDDVEDQGYHEPYVSVSDQEYDE